MLTWRPKTNRTSVTEFCYKSGNLTFEKLINKKTIIFPIQELFKFWRELIRAALLKEKVTPERLLTCSCLSL